MGIHHLSGLLSGLCNPDFEHSARLDTKSSASPAVVAGTWQHSSVTVTGGPQRCMRSGQGIDANDKIRFLFTSHFADLSFPVLKRLLRSPSSTKAAANLQYGQVLISVDGQTPAETEPSQSPGDKKKRIHTSYRVATVRESLLCVYRKFRRRKWGRFQNGTHTQRTHLEEGFAIERVRKSIVRRRVHPAPAHFSQQFRAYKKRRSEWVGEQSD